MLQLAQQGLMAAVAGVAATYDGQIAALSPIAYWKGDETSSAWIDNEGVENGTIVNSPLTAVDTIVDLDSGGAAARFNGTNQHIVIAHNAALKPSTGALIITFQLDALAEKATLLAGDDNTAAGGLSVEVEADGSPRCFIRDSGGQLQGLVGADGLVGIDIAHAFAVTWGANGFIGYVWDADENLIWTDSLTGVTDGLVGTSEFRIGAWHTGVSRADGVISRVALFDVQLSQTQLETVALPRTLGAPDVLGYGADVLGYGADEVGYS